MLIDFKLKIISLFAFIYLTIMLLSFMRTLQTSEIKLFYIFFINFEWTSYSVHTSYSSPLLKTAYLCVKISFYTNFSKIGNI